MKPNWKDAPDFAKWLAQHENYEVKYYQCQQEQASLLAKQITDQLDAVGRL